MTSVQTKTNSCYQTINQGPNDQREAQLDEAREHVLAAVQVFRSLGPEYERIGWLLEDALSYLNESHIDSAEQVDVSEIISQTDKAAEIISRGTS